MPACSPGNPRPSSAAVPASFPQRPENTGLKSSRTQWRVIAGGAGADAHPEVATTSFAGRTATRGWRRRYLQWMEARLPRTGTDLFARLPFIDAVALAALVGTGRMTWPELTRALDALIKLTAADAVGGHCAKHPARSSGDAAKHTVEEEIWARYHAQCDEVFARSSPRDTWSPEHLWRTERILERLRGARDRELAAVLRRLDAGPSTTAASEIRLELSPAENAALAKLNASGFIPSASMMAAIGNLVSEIIGTTWVGTADAAGAAPSRSMQRARLLRRVGRNRHLPRPQLRLDRARVGRHAVLDPARV